MMRKWLFATVMLLPGAAAALGLGKLDLNSALNEPFDARIELLSASVEELDSMKATLASPEAFERAGLQYGFGLSQLKFEVRESESGPDYIRVYSTEAMREPFLNFLLEVNWSQGRLFREYTVLLDPPTYDPNRKMAELSPAPVSSAEPPVPSSTAESYDPVQTSQVSQVSSPVINYAGGDFGPTGAGDTLWSIASSMRPDSSVSVQQMMIALLRANPEAFIDNNINGLKRGQILSMPDDSVINSIGKSEAIELAKSQNSLWNDIRTGMADAATDRAESAGVSGAESDTTMSTDTTMVEDDAELRLVAPDGSGAGIDEAMTEPGADEENQQLLALASETIAALELENSELSDKVVESESIIEDLKRLIELKEDELAALQNQIASAAAMEEAAVEEEMPAEAEMVEDAVAEQEEEMAGEETADEEQASSEEEMAMEAEADTEMETTPADAGIMGMVDQYLGPVIEMVKSNLLVVGGVVGGLIVLLLGFVGYKKFQSGKAETVDIPEAEFPDFEDVTEAADDAAAESMMDIDDAEAETVLPEGDDEEDKTPTPQAPEMDDTSDDATQIATPEPEAEAEEEPEEEEDPLAEVNVFMAFDQFDQAIDFVKNAIEGDPDNLDFHTRLLEVYYAAGDKKGYEEHARVLNEKVNGEGAHWDSAVAMWSDMSPNRALFEAGADEEDETPAESAGGGVMDLTAGEEETAEEADAGGLDFDIGGDDDDGMLDVTAGADIETGEESSSEDSDEDVLDVTSAIDTENDEEDLLDVTAAVGLDDHLAAEEAEESPAEEEDLLDITGGGADDDVLDVTAAGDAGAPDESLEMSEPEETPAEEEDLLDITGGGADDDVLDVTAAGDATDLDESLEMSEPEETSTEEEDLLDITGGGNDDVLDISAGAEPVSSDDDLLDISQSGGEDLLDVTTSTNLTPDSDEDLLDVTSASSVGADTDGLLEIDTGESADDNSDDSSLDFDMEGLDLDMSDDSTEEKSDSVIEQAMDVSDEDNVIDFDSALGSDDDDADVEGTVEVDAATLGIDTASDDTTDESETPEVELDLTMDMETTDESEAESTEEDLSISLDVPDSDDSTADDISLDMELDMGDETADAADDDATSEFSLDLDSESSSSDLDLDLEIDEEVAPETPVADEGVPEIDMESTVELPKGKVDSLTADDDDDDEEKTVFVPKSNSQQQSQEDEISTKLDLAKAYVELGDGDSAKSILDEIIQEGSEEQKQQAQELLDQV